MANQKVKPQETQQAAPPPQPEVATQTTQAPTPKIEPEKVLFNWKAPARPFKKREKEFWVRLVAIASVLGFVLYIVEGAMPVILLIALMFLFYILSTVEPEVIEYAITNKGVRIADKTNEWELMTRFWFSKRQNSDLLVFEMLVIPGRLELIINEADMEELRKAISPYVVEEEAAPTRMDKATNWISKRIS